MAEVEGLLSMVSEQVATLQIRLVNCMSTGQLEGCADVRDGRLQRQISSERSTLSALRQRAADLASLQASTHVYLVQLDELLEARGESCNVN